MDIKEEGVPIPFDMPIKGLTRPSLGQETSTCVPQLCEKRVTVYSEFPCIPSLSTVVSVAFQCMYF